MATGFCRTTDDFEGNRRGIIDVDDGRRFGAANGRQGWFTPQELEEEQERRREDHRDEVVDFDDYDR